MPSAVRRRAHASSTRTRWDGVGREFTCFGTHTGSLQVLLKAVQDSGDAVM